MILVWNRPGCQMGERSTEAIRLLAASAGLDLGDEAEAVAERLEQLVGFARELDGLVADDGEIDAVFDPSWDSRR